MGDPRANQPPRVYPVTLDHLSLADLKFRCSTQGTLYFTPINQMDWIVDFLRGSTLRYKLLVMMPNLRGSRETSSRL